MMLSRRRPALIALVAAILPWSPALAGVILTGSDTSSTHVREVDGVTLATRHSFFAFASPTQGVRVASADFNADGVSDVIVAPGPGMMPLVNAFNGATTGGVHSFLAYDAAFTGGVYVAAGDVTGDSVPDIVTGPGAGGLPNVRVFNGVTGVMERSFLAYGSGFAGGVRVAVGDLNGDGKAEIITGAGPGGAPHVKVFDGATNDETASFFAFSPSFTGGVFVAAGDFNGDLKHDIVVGPDAGGMPLVRVLDGTTQAEIHAFNAFDPAFTGGVRVAAGDVNSDGVDDLILGTGPGISATVRALSGAGLAPLQSYFPYTPSFAGGVFVAGLPAPIPEPAAIAFAGLATPLLLRRRR